MYAYSRKRRLYAVLCERDDRFVIFAQTDVLPITRHLQRHLIRAVAVWIIDDKRVARKDESLRFFLRCGR